MKLNLLALAFVALPLLTAQASNTVVTNFTTVAATKPNAHPVMLADGATLIPSGSGTVATGFFSLADGAITAISTPAAWTTALGSFQQFGTTGTVGGASALNNAGLYKLTAGQANLAGSAFDGKNIYTVIGNGASLAASTQVLVFKSTSTFAVDPTPEGTGPFLGTPPAGSLLLGSFGTPGAFYPAGLMANITSTPAVAVNLVPEPATALLGVLSLGFGFIRRRR